MASKKKIYRDKDPYSEETIRRKRKFPTLNTVLLFLLVVLQVTLLLAAILHTPKPQDIIEEYALTVEPRSDGSLDMEYSFVWKALDEEEPLTWIDIGVPNENFTVYADSLSSTIARAEKYVEDGYVSTRLYLKKSYMGGERVKFSFRINQKNMLCQDGDGYFYELIPGWFNATPVEHYTFRWKTTDGFLSANTETERFDYRVWEGEMACGSYVMMNVRYADDAFSNANITFYQPFDDSGVTDDLADTKAVIVFMAVIAVLLIVIAEVYIVDSYVSYGRGRGFLCGYGYHVHTYGRVNPHYKKEQEKHAESRGGSFHGGGCACACACACAGGGRAGCSRKDTYSAK